MFRSRKKLWGLFFGEYMKRILKNIWSSIIYIPNGPFWWLISFFIIIKLLNDYTVSEILLKGDDLWNDDELLNYIESIYPEYLEYVVAAVFYFFLIKFAFY